MDGMELFCCFSLVFASGYIVAYRQFKPSPPPKKKVAPDEMDVVQAMAIIERLNATKNKYKKADDMLTTAQLGGTIRCKFDDGEVYSLGENSVAFAEKERARLRTSLLRDVDALCNLRRNGITQSVTQSSRKSRGRG